MASPRGSLAALARVVVFIRIGASGKLGKRGGAYQHAPSFGKQELPAPKIGNCTPTKISVVCRTRNMLKPRISILCLLMAVVTGGPCHAQSVPAAGVSEPAAKETNPLAFPPGGKSASDGSIFIRKNARAITLKIPAPRGQITDREGRTFAQSQVAYQVGLQFTQFENADRNFIVNWARTRLATLQTLVKNAVPKTDDELYDHYQKPQRN